MKQTECDLCYCEQDNSEIIFFRVIDSNNYVDAKAVCCNCYDKIREKKMSRNEEFKAAAERAEQKRLEAIAKRREQRRQEKELYGGQLMSNEQAQQEQDEEVLYFVCFVIFVVSTIALWFGAS
jgi:uncharacterized Fe-S cluster-containing radical SAM superfamily protein